MSYDDNFGFPHIHSQVAWNNFLAQHVGKQYTQDYVLAFYPPLDLLDQSQSDLLDNRGILTSEGAQLDGVGNIVGIDRELDNTVFLPFFGFSAQPAGKGFNQARIRRDREPYASSRTMGDIEYQKAILNKIALNNGHGTANDIITIVNYALNVTGTTVVDIGDATAEVIINDLTITTADPRFGIIDKIIPRAAGVKIWPELAKAGNTFGFQNQGIYFGFKVGILARSPQGNVPSISDPGLSTLDISFLTGALDSRITFTRASTATYFDVNGLIQTAGNNVPRFGYDPITHAARGLFIEEGRTNRFLQSGDFTNASWTKSNCTLAAGISGPNGATTGSGIIGNTGATGSILQSITAIASTTYTMSCFVKAGTQTTVQILMSGTWFTGGLNRVGTYNLTAGTSTPSGVGATSSIVSIGNGWYRISLSATPDLAVAASHQIVRANASGDGVSVLFYAFGAQIEAGAFVTSYIPTTTATVARAIETTTMSLDPWFNAATGTISIDTLQTTANANNSWIGDFGDSTANNEMGLFISNTAGGQVLFRNAGTSIYNPTVTSGLYTAGTAAKSAFAWQAANATWAVNGVIRNNAGAVTGTLPIVTSLTIGHRSGGTGQLNGYVRRLQYWRRALSNTELQSVTT